MLLFDYMLVVVETWKRAKVNHCLNSVRTNLYHRRCFDYPHKISHLNLEKLRIKMVDNVWYYLSFIYFCNNILFVGKSYVDYILVLRMM